MEDVSIRPTRLLGGREEWVSGSGWAFGGEALVGEWQAAGVMTCC